MHKSGRLLERQNAVNELGFFLRKGEDYQNVDQEPCPRQLLPQEFCRDSDCMLSEFLHYTMRANKKCKPFLIVKRMQHQQGGRSREATAYRHKSSDTVNRDSKRLFDSTMVSCAFLFLTGDEILTSDFTIKWTTTSQGHRKVRNACR